MKTKITIVQHVKKLQHEDNSTIIAAAALNSASIFPQSSPLGELHVCQGLELLLIFESTSHNMKDAHG